MAKNTLSDLRDHLFATMEALTDKDKPMEVDRAHAICGVAEAIINTAKVEVKAMEALGIEPAGQFFGSTKLLPRETRWPKPTSKAVE